MRNTGIVLFLIGIYIVLNSGSLRDVVFGKASVSFLNPQERKTGGSRRTNNPDDPDGGSVVGGKLIGYDPRR